MITLPHIQVKTYGGLQVKKSTKKKKYPQPDTGSGEQPPPKPK